MSSVASRELRNQTRQLLDRVAAGEHVTITVRGEPVAQLVPPATRKRWTPRASFLAAINQAQADPGLRDELALIVGNDSTDDLPWR